MGNQGRGQYIHEIGRLVVHAPHAGLDCLLQIAARAQGTSEARGASTGTHLVSKQTDLT